MPDLQSIPTPAKTPGDTTWFNHDRFGLFIHWGIYAMAARHEWVKSYEEISDEDYQPYFDHFDPDLYDPDQWAQAAAAAGMKYFAITTKHHDGFCLWDSKLTDYKATNTPAGRDLIKPMVDAFRQQNIRIGFYHSLIDWHHRQFVIDNHHSQRNHPDRQKLNAGRDQSKYIPYLHGQVRELLTEFGRIDLLFLDFSYPPEKGRRQWDSDNLYKLIRELAPDIVLNDRADLDEGWDYKTPEQFQPQQWLHVDGKPVNWEACQTFSGSWGYHRDEATWKTLGQLVRMLIDIVSKGGNLILNVGPTGRGEFDERALDRLRGIGRWMHHHDRAIYGCTQAPAEFTPPPDCRYTYNPATNRLYLHFFAWPFKHIYLPNLGERVKYAQFLHDASQIKTKVDPWFTNQAGGGTNEPTTLALELPVTQPDVTVPVVELFLK